MTPLVLSTSTRQALTRLAADFQRVFAARFVSLVAYGENASAAFVADITADDLAALGPLVDAWHRDGLFTPLVITPDEFRRSLDAFPLQYQAMLDRHAVIAGVPPFDGVSVRPEDIRHACEIEARGHLIHLRQGWLQAAGHDERLAEMIVRSAAPFRSLLAHVARLEGQPAGSDIELGAFAERAMGISADLVRAVLDAGAHPERGQKAVSRLADYLDGARHLWSFVDAWRAQ